MFGDRNKRSNRHAILENSAAINLQTNKYKEIIWIAEEISAWRGK